MNIESLNVTHPAAENNAPCTLLSVDDAGDKTSPSVIELTSNTNDDAMSKYGTYVPFMDICAILVKTKHQLRRIIKLTHKILNLIKLKMHPDKTFIGCIKKGFDFLGVRFGDTPEISKTSLENHQTKIAQRYAQGASAACIGDLKARWSSWCAGVLKCCIKEVHNSMELERGQPTGSVVLKENKNENFINQLKCPHFSI